LSAAADPEITGWRLQGSIHWHAHALGEYEQDGQQRSWKETVANGVGGAAAATFGGDAAVAAAAAAPGKDGLRNSSYLQVNCFNILCPRFLLTQDHTSTLSASGIKHVITVPGATSRWSWATHGKKPVTLVQSRGAHVIYSEGNQINELTQICQIAAARWQLSTCFVVVVVECETLSHAICAPVHRLLASGRKRYGERFGPVAQGK